MNIVKKAALAATLALPSFSSMYGAGTLEVNPLTVEPMAVVPGEEAWIVMNYETDDSFQGFEFQLRLPEGVDYVEDPDQEGYMDIPEVNSALTKTHQLTGKIHGNGVCKCAFVSMKNAVIKSGGWLLKIPVMISETFTGMETGELYNCRYGAENGYREEEYLQPTEFMIYVAPVSIDLSETSKLMEIGDTEKLEVEYSPEEAYKMPLTWESSDESVATVDEEGNLTAVGLGKATVTVYVTDKPEVKATCEVEVVEEIPTSVKEILSAESESLIFTLDGVLVKSDLNMLAPGAYIVKSETKVMKIVK